MENMEFLAQFDASDLSPAQRLLELDGMRDSKEDIDAERALDEKRGRAALRREVREFANQQMGDPRGNLRRSEDRLAGLRNDRAELLAKLKRLDEKIDGAESGVTFWATRMGEVEAMVSRNAPVDPLDARRSHDNELFAESIQSALAGMRAPR